MIKVVCSVPESRFRQYGITYPEGWNVIYIDASEESMLANIKGADFLFTESMNTVSAKVIEASDKLKMIHTQGVGFNYVDVQAAAKKGVFVCNNKAVNSKCVAEHTVGLMLAGLRRTVSIDRECKKARFDEACLEYRARGSWELSDRHVGIVGFGAIGREVVKLLKPFGCKVSYFDEYRPSQEVEDEYGVAYLPIADLLKQCNIISLHVPVLPSTRMMINKETLATMQKETLLINSSRGEIIDSEALADALEKGIIYGAALDTIYPEPPAADHPLLKMSPEAMDKLILTSHVAGTSNSVFTNMLVGAINNMKRIVAGEKPINIQNGL